MSLNGKDRSVSRSRRDRRRDAALDYARRVQNTFTPPALEAAPDSQESSPLPSEDITTTEKRRSSTTPNKLTPGKVPKYEFEPALNIYRSDRANILETDRATIAEAITTLQVTNMLDPCRNLNR